MQHVSIEVGNVKFTASGDHPEKLIADAFLAMKNNLPDAMLAAMVDACNRASVAVEVKSKDR